MPEMADVEILRAAGHRRMPWKNGGGETREIAVSPPNASLDTLDWRISMAVVAQNGPFSSFPGIDRTLSLLSGAGMALDFGEPDKVFRLTQQSDPFTFAAELPVVATLSGTSITDLNVMTRRGRYRHTVRRVRLDKPQRLRSSADQWLLFCAQGNVSCALAGQAELTLGPDDGLMLKTRGRSVEASVATTDHTIATIYVMELYSTPNAASV